MTAKIVIAARPENWAGTDWLRCPDVPGLRGCAVLLPDTGEAAPDPTGMAFVWVDDADKVDVTAAFPGPVEAWLVDETVQWDGQRDGGEGVSSGIVRVSFVRRRPGLSRDEFARHWTEVHAPLARMHHPALWRYVQNVVVRPLTPDARDIDGVAELGFRSRDDLEERMYDSDEGRAIVGADIGTFLDVSAGHRVVCREHVVRAGPDTDHRQTS
jgi:uncharacterized protein (TIGR02118 family)